MQIFNINIFRKIRVINVPIFSKKVDKHILEYRNYIYEKTITYKLTFNIQKIMKKKHTDFAHAVYLFVSYFRGNENWAGFTLFKKYNFYNIPFVILLLLLHCKEDVMLLFDK